MSKLIEKKYYGYEDVFIVPTYSDIKSRHEVDTETVFKSKHSDVTFSLEVPIISANMDTVTESKMAIALSHHGAIGALHRFCSIEENVEMFKKVRAAGSAVDCFVSIGVNSDYQERAIALYNAGARKFIIDIAHGHSEMMKTTLTWLRNKFGRGIFIMAGNVTTPDGVAFLDEHGADAIKCGIGPGCFAGGTRILMANGTYKNIENIVKGEFVINKNGKAVKVLNAFSTGIRKVVKVKTNHFYKPTLVTADHRYWVGDLSSTSKKTISRCGYSKLLDKKAKNIPKVSKYKWQEIGNAENSIALLPKNIDFVMPTTFNIELKNKISGNWKTGFEYAVTKTLTPSYELGYIFGTFLGDGHARTPKGKAKESNSVNWFFGSQEHSIANKLSNCIESVFQKTATIKQTKKGNVLTVSFYDKSFADFISSFGKRNNKSLPDCFLVNDEKYLMGIYDGLIDSDGNISKDGRHSIHNTSPQIIELYNIVNFLTKKHFPLNEYREPSAGGLKNVKVENCRNSFVARNLKNYKTRLTKDYQVVKFMNIEPQEFEVKVYDLEVDCETHSFIADNAIVHNSVCLTKDVTGVTMPIFSATLECANVPGLEDINLISDGGCKAYGDVAKAIGAGARAVMSGYFFSGCEEAPESAKTFDASGNEVFIYRGMASSDAMRKIRSENLPTPEGKSIVTNPKGSVGRIVEEIHGALRSSYSYVGARNTEQFVSNVSFALKQR